MTHPSARLEEAARYWEDRFFLDHVLAENSKLQFEDTGKTVPFTGPIRHWQDLRRHLMELVAMGGKKFSAERFVGSSEAMIGRYGALSGYASYLATWTRHSRRVFHLTTELQALLSAMSFGEIKWGDVLLPFEGFAITLEQPIAHGDELYDAILVSTELPGLDALTGDGEFLAVTLISQRMEGYRSMESYDKRFWRSVVTKNKPSLHDQYLRYRTRCGTKLPLLSFVLKADQIRDKMAAEPISEGSSLRKFDVGPAGEALSKAGGMSKLLDDTFRVIAGLCLYLVSLPSNSPHRSGWKPISNSGKPDPKAITNEAQVCEVSSVFELTPEEVDAFLASSTRRGKGKGPCAHFRRGYYRRRAGEGHDLSAPKVILVRPALVRGDRLAAGQLPGGSVARLK